LFVTAKAFRSGCVFLSRIVSLLFSWVGVKRGRVKSHRERQAEGWRCANRAARRVARTRECVFAPLPRPCSAAVGGYCSVPLSAPTLEKAVMGEGITWPVNGRDSEKDGEAAK